MDETIAQLNKFASGLPQLKAVQRVVKNPHLLQLYVNLGHSECGPWIALGVNGREYIVGFVKK